MISFVPLLEGGICSPSLWWDHSELADHRNGCTSLCSLQIRSMGGISAFSFCLFFYPLCLTCRMTEKRQGWDISWMLALCLALHGAQRRRGERMKRAVGQTWLLCHATAQKTESPRRLGLQNTQVGGGRAVSFSCTSLWNTCCSIWFLFLSREVFFTVGRTSYKYSVFIILLEFIQYAELRSIKWGEGGKIPQDKRNSDAFQNKHSTPWRGTGTVCAWLPNRGSCTSSNFVCIL